jgi:hypothetical protein
MIGSSYFRPAIARLVCAVALLATASSPARGQVIYTIRDLLSPVRGMLPLAGWVI